MSVTVTSFLSDVFVLAIAWSSLRYETQMWCNVASSRPLKKTYNVMINETNIFINNYLPASEHIWLVLASMYEFGGGFGSVTDDNWSKNTIIRSLFFRMNGLTTSMYCSCNIVSLSFSRFSVEITKRMNVNSFGVFNYAFFNLSQWTTKHLIEIVLHFTIRTSNW